VIIFALLLALEQMFHETVELSNVNERKKLKSGQYTVQNAH